MATLNKGDNDIYIYKIIIIIINVGSFVWNYCSSALSKSFDRNSYFTGKFTL